MEADAEVRRLHVDAGNLAREVIAHTIVPHVSLRCCKTSIMCDVSTAAVAIVGHPAFNSQGPAAMQVIIAERRPLVIPGLDGRVARLQADILIARRQWQALAAELESTANSERCKETRLRETVKTGLSEQTLKRATTVTDQQGNPRL